MKSSRALVKFVSLVMCMLMVCIAFSGCTTTKTPAVSTESTGNSTEPAPETTATDETPEGEVLHVALMQCTWSDAMKEQLEAFKAETGIEVVFEQLSMPELRNKILLNLVAETSEYDLISVEQGWLGEMYQPEYLEDLSPYVEQYGLDLNAYFQPALNYWGYAQNSDVLQGIPIDIDCRYVFVNTALFEKAGIEYVEGKQYSTTEFIELCEKLNDPDNGIYAFSMDPNQTAAILYQGFLRSNGGDWLDANNYPLLDQPEALEALQFMQSLMQYCPPDTANNTWAENLLAMQTGNVAMSTQPNTFALNLVNKTDSAIADNVGWIALPKFGDKEVSYAYGGWAWCIPTASPKKDAAFKFINYINSEENMKERALKYAIGPVLVSLFEDEEVLSAQPWYRFAAEALNHADGFIKLSISGTIKDDIETEVMSCMAGTQTPEATLERLQNKFLELLKTNGFID